MYLPTEENAAARPKTMLEVINNDLSMDSWTIASYDQDLIKSGIFRRDSDAEPESAILAHSTIVDHQASTPTCNNRPSKQAPQSKTKADKAQNKKTAITLSPRKDSGSKATQATQ